MNSAVIFVMGVDYPKKYPWVGQILKTSHKHFFNEYHPGLVRLTCFGDLSGKHEPSHSSFTAKRNKNFSSSNSDGSPGVTYVGFHVENSDWWQTCFHDLSGSSRACSEGVVTSAIKADMQWLGTLASGSAQQPASRTLTLQMTSAEIQQFRENARRNRLDVHRRMLAETGLDQEPCCMPCIRACIRALCEHHKMETKKSSETNTKHIIVKESGTHGSCDFAVCFVFVAHEFGGGRLEDLAEEYKNMLEGVQRKAAFVVVLCDPQNKKLHSQAFLLARLSGGFVVRPTHQIELFPGKLMQLLDLSSSLLSSTWYEDFQRQQRLLGPDRPTSQEVRRKIAFKEDQIAKLLEEECYLKSRAKVYSACDEQAPAHEHLKTFVSYVMQRQREVPLPGHAFPNVDDVLSGGSACTSRRQVPGGLVQDWAVYSDQNCAADEALRHCLARIQEMERTITQQALVIQQLEEKLQSEKKTCKRGKRGGKRTKPKTGCAQHDEPDLSSESEDLPCDHAWIPDTASDWSAMGQI